MADLGPSVDISYLINFCINHPLPLKSPAGLQATVLLSIAHTQIYPKLILDYTNQGLINEYGNQLMEAQRWIALVPSVETVDLTKFTPYLSEDKRELLKHESTHSANTVQVSQQLPIAVLLQLESWFCWVSI